MKATKILAMIAFVAATALMTSCLKGGKAEGFKVTQTYPGYFNETINENTGETTYYAGVGYTLEIDYYNNVADLKIEGLQTPEGKCPTLLFSEVPVRTNDRGWLEITLTDAVPEGLGSFVKVPHFDKLIFKTANRYINEQFVPVVDISYRINNQYRIYSLPGEMIEVGTTTVVNRLDDTKYTPDDNNDNCMYIILFDTANKTARVTVAGAKFHKDMPAMNIRFKDIPFETTPTGEIIIQKQESFTPYLLTGNALATASETPMPAFPISGLKITYDPDRGIWISFTCTIDNPNIKGVFDVTTINQYPEKASEK